MRWNNKKEETVKTLMRCVLVGFILLPGLAGAQSAQKGLSICEHIEKNINVLVDYTRTSCFPSSGNVRGAYSFIIISSKSVFSIEASKKAWLLVAVASVGDALNKDDSVKADELWLSDANLMKDRVAYVMPVGTAKSLQRQIRANQITLEAMYTQILKCLTRRTIRKR